MKQVVINGKPYSFKEGQTILMLLHNIGIAVPALCYDERIPPAAVCRTCLVNVKGGSRLLPSCRTLLVNGMEIETHTPWLENYRKGILEMLAKNYPLSALTGDRDKEFHKWLRHFGITGKMEGGNESCIDTSHPYIQVDMSRCINCFRCVNICNDVQGQFVWHIINRGDRERIVPDSKGLFSESSCVSCGACSDTCPTGAIEDKSTARFGPADQETRSVCAYCGVGCEIGVRTKNQRITGIHAAANAPVNKGHLCVKGRYAWEYNYAEDRVTSPMIRNSDGWKEVSWEEAIGYCAERLRAVLHDHGPANVGIIGSARATNEENYLIQKFARTVIGTNNVDNCARVCHQPTAKAMTMLMGTGATTNSFDDIEKAKMILIAGSDTTGSHPVIGARIKQMALKGTSLVVIDPRKTEIAKYATHHLQLKAGTNIPLLNAMANVIIGEGLYNSDFVHSRTEGWDAFKECVSEWTPERAGEICFLDPGQIRDAARLYAITSPAMCFHGLGLTEHTQGTENVMALVNLALITGNIGKEGSGINPLRGQNNVQGAAAMGCDPAVYTGMAPVGKERQRFEKLWETSLPAERGLNLPEMLDAASAGGFRAMWITGYDIFFTMPNASRSEDAFSKMDFVVVQDIFMNETAKRFADVFLPVASSFEKDGTFMNAERRIQRIRKAIPPPFGVKADWEVVCDIAAAMGYKDSFGYSGTDEIWNEIRNAWNAVYGITYDRLEQGGIQWPCPDIVHPGTKILHTTSFSTGSGKAKLASVDFRATPEQPTRQYPFVLITGRELYHFNSGTMTYRTEDIEISDSDFLHMHPEDAILIGLKNGEWARVTSKYGEVSLTVRIDGSLRRGEVFGTFSNTSVFINQLTSPLRDSYVQTPEYKVTAVQIERVA